ncbi:MAG: hypothetical protein MUE91_02015 [Ignavibacteriaceae bacterium]|jgi:hypothetical protein|nr:hypothetical protein [Ignavibacteriaceae bacterium]MCU0413169.1 hypothetical protein [Ignavibacteriaceae bacterium]
MNKKNKLILSSVVAVILLIVSVVILTKEPSETDSGNKKVADKNLLVGDWLRTDAGYRIVITKVNQDGTLDAQYFNPNPINIGKTNWEENNGNLKIIIELRDVNYPGSTYTLSYLPDRDVLAGDYYQAVEGITFYVEFARNQ